MCIMLQPSKDLVCSDQAKSEVLPVGVEKEECLSIGSTGGGKRDVEESSSACSGSLLGNLVSHYYKVYPSSAKLEN